MHGVHNKDMEISIHGDPEAFRQWAQQVREDILETLDEGLDRALVLGDSEMVSYFVAQLAVYGHDP